MTHLALSSDAMATGRDDPCHYTLPGLPPEFAVFETPVEGLGVGRPGKVGLLELAFAPSGGTTRIMHHFQQFPLQVFRPVYLDPYRPEMAFVYILSHGGMVQGDRYRLDVTCEPGASVHVTTQSTTKIYRMERNYATQLVRLAAGPESFLEYLPDPIVPFRDARFYGKTLLTIHPTASVILGEILLPGRVAHGEHHDYALFASDLVVRSLEGDLCFCDTIKFAPQRTPSHSPGRLGVYTALASLFVVTNQVSARSLSAQLHGRVTDLPEVVGGASELPNGSGAWVRLLGTSSLGVSAALHAAWDEARLALLGVPAPPRHKT